MAFVTPRAGAGAPGVTAASVDDRRFCHDMLPKVSRTFAICIRLLPPDLEHPVLIAYLLCRVADTIEDSTRLPPEEKGRLLRAFGDSLGDSGPDDIGLSDVFAEAESDEERLARRADAVVREFRIQPTTRQDAIRPWVQEMCVGMAEFASRKRAGTASHIEALTTVDELDRYCYYVAGTVGHLLTELFHLHGSVAHRAPYRTLKRLATSFGLGLQLTNIIKDVADDRRRGWSFVPQELCQLAGITPEELHDGRHGAAAQQVMHVLIDKAKQHLLDALEYTVVLPRTAYGIRLFCLTALYFAVQTLELAERDDRLLDPAHKVKISRMDVVRTIAVSRIVAPSNLLVRSYFRRLARTRWERAGNPPTL
jgi:farnesyl-diphosphate farnesyltransferase